MTTDFTRRIDLIATEKAALDALGRKFPVLFANAANPAQDFADSIVNAKAPFSHVIDDPQGVVSIKHSLYTPYDGGGFERLPRIIFAWTYSAFTKNDIMDNGVVVEFVPAYTLHEKDPADPHEMQPRILRVARSAQGEVLYDEKVIPHDGVRAIVAYAIAYEQARQAGQTASPKPSQP